MQANQQEWYFVTKIGLAYFEKEMFQWSRKLLKITGTIFSNSERSEQFLVTESFLTCSWRFLISNKSELLKFKLEKIIGI